MTPSRSYRLTLVSVLVAALNVSPTTSFMQPIPLLSSLKLDQKTSFNKKTFAPCASSSNENEKSITSLFADSELKATTKKIFHSIAVASTILSVALTPNLALADEYGVEKEAPTLFTGESLMICVKRGPLGACQKTEERTPKNDNDKAAQYFKNPGSTVVDKDLAMRNSFQLEPESELITRLKQQTSDNRERNEQIVKMKSLENDQSANFGPFDRQVVILNEDGKTFTLLENPQAMRLKKMGYIKDRRFIKQPTKEVIDKALESDDVGFGEIFKELFGDSK